jgi:hypothetical protein
MDRRLIFIIPIILLVPIILLTVGITVATTSAARFARHNSRVGNIHVEVESATVAIQEIYSSETASVLERFPNLSVIDSVGIAGNLRLAVEDVCHLNINAPHGTIFIGTHDEDDSTIQVKSPGAITYDLNRNRGILDITTNHQVISIFVPHNHYEAIFEYVTIRGGHSTITLKGYDNGNTFLAENLSVVNQHGAIILSDIVVSGQLDVSNRHGNITIHNVIADSDRLNVTNPNGRVFVS